MLDPIEVKEKTSNDMMQELSALEGFNFGNGVTPCMSRLGKRDIDICNGSVCSACYQYWIDCDESIHTSQGDP
jgi:hypothetical protein